MPRGKKEPAEQIIPYAHTTPHESAAYSKGTLLPHAQPPSRWLRFSATLVGAGTSFFRMVLMVLMVFMVLMVLMVLMVYGSNIRRSP